MIWKSNTSKYCIIKKIIFGTISQFLNERLSLWNQMECI